MPHPDLPEGELLRRAIRWIDAQRRLDRPAPVIQLIETAGKQFDLSPKDCNFLINFFTHPVEK